MIFRQKAYSELVLPALFQPKDDTAIYAKKTGSCKSEIAKGLLLQNFCVSEI